MFTRLLHAWKAFFSRGCLTTFALRLACVLGAYKLDHTIRFTTSPPSYLSSLPYTRALF